MLYNIKCIIGQLYNQILVLWLTIIQLFFSAYFPCFRSMFRNVVAALNEAQDITLYLKPLKQHFKVSNFNEQLLAENFQNFILYIFSYIYIYHIYIFYL